MNIDEWLTVVTVLGLVGAGLLVCAACLGVVMSSRTTKYIPLLKGKTFPWHKWGTVSVGIIILAHSLFSLTTFGRTEITWVNIVVPFSATKETVWLGLGSIALYMLAFTITVSLTIRTKQQKLWRVLHYGTYAMLGFGLVHGLFISSTFLPDWRLDILDAEKLFVELLIIIIMAALILRIYVRKRWGVRKQN